MGVPVIGGSLDGASIPRRGAFIILDGALYQLRDGGYHHVENRLWHCGGCGAYVDKSADSCPLCGYAAPASRGTAGAA